MRLDQVAARAADFIFGAKAQRGLSSRVRRRIEEHQATSEIIIGWIQACAISFFAIVYTISPKAFPPDTPFEPVPWTLGIYAVFTAVRIALAYRRHLTRGFLTVSTVVDIAVLMITIWSFHLQYQAPPALYLKAPTLMYVFILIALRTLRFEPLYVLIAGSCSALGWLALFVYAVLRPGEAAPAFTHSYVDYITSYRILGGAEIDKILSILMVTAILALALVRARKLLVNSIEEELAAADLARFFPSELADQLRHAQFEPVKGQGVRCDAAILAIDLRGFTQLSHDLSPGELMGLLGEYHSRLVPVIERYHGSIDKYLGDGILASFGAVAPSTNHASDLCCAIEALIAVTQAWQAERRESGLPALAIGMAGAAGEVVFGVIGHETRLEYTVIGEVVNLVTKLEKATKQNGVPALVTRQTYDLAIAQGFTPLGAVKQLPGRLIAGVADPIDLIAFTRHPG
ncbi:adenylate/guanylate cyclase domain-containing protein [Aminobacter ciceronei]|uniref:Adenylate cyclase n=1 Tax=Aminobacter ciceronei TaxID=150723 RepID=A0ABR6C9P4_9HYPH|nr:adenylate/guanylate cyclase domain-containing protein [Aminobacter ciceronei]MBA8907584.1 adenylate cyclase [Aminobacter ciceronei]MBA9021315.1 adenylate cyclase [Aminobacter ciceronei]